MLAFGTILPILGYLAKSYYMVRCLVLLDLSVHVLLILMGDLSPSKQKQRRSVGWEQRGWGGSGEKRREGKLQPGYMLVL